MTQYIGAQPTLVPVSVPYRYRKFKSNVGRKIFNLEHDPAFVDVRIDGKSLIRGDDFTSINANNGIKLSDNISITDAKTIVEVFAYSVTQSEKAKLVDEALIRSALSNRFAEIDIDTTKNYLVANAGNNIEFTRSSVSRCIDLELDTMTQRMTRSVYGDEPLVNSMTGLLISGQCENLLPAMDYLSLTTIQAMNGVNSASYTFNNAGTSITQGLSVTQPLIYKHLAESVNAADKSNLFSTGQITGLTDGELITFSLDTCSGDGVVPIAFACLYYNATTGYNIHKITIDRTTGAILTNTVTASGTPGFTTDVDTTQVVSKIVKLNKAGWNRITVSLKLGKVSRAAKMEFTAYTTVTTVSATANAYCFFENFAVIRSGFPRNIVPTVKVMPPDVLSTESPLDFSKNVSVACKVSVPDLGRYAFAETLNTFSDNRRFLFSGVLTDNNDIFAAYIEPAASPFSTTQDANLVFKIGTKTGTVGEFRYPIKTGTDSEIDLLFTQVGNQATLIVNGDIDSRSDIIPINSYLKKLMIGCAGDSPDTAFGFLNGAVKYIKVWNTGIDIEQK